MSPGPVQNPEPSRVAEHGELNGHGRRFVRKITDEFKKFLAMAVYLWVMFGLFALHESIVLEQHKVSFKFYGFAIINSLVLAKVMLIAEDLHLGERFRNKPLVYSILYKAFLFAIVFIVFDVVEEMIVGLVRGKTIAQSIPEIGGGSLSGIVSVGVIITVALTPFFAFREVGRVIGTRELRALFLTSGRQVGPHDSQR